MDVFAEQIVRKPSDGKTLALKVLICLLTALLTLVSVVLMLAGLFIATVLLFGAVYGGYFLLTGLDIEYEYIVTNGEMDIDKIIAKRKRKRLITVKAASFERIGKLAEAPETESGVTLVKADGISEGGTELYFADLEHSAIGKVRLIFSPEEKILEGLKPFLPRQVRAEYEKSRRANG